MRFLLLLFIVLQSCSILYPDGLSFSRPNYSYEYTTFSKKLNFKNDTYLLAPTSFHGSNRLEVLDYVHNYFKSELGNRLVSTYHLKDESGAKKILKRIDYDTAFDDLEFLSEISDHSYLILTKITYLKDNRYLDVNRHHKKSKGLKSDVKTGAKSSIKVLDLIEKSVFLEIECSGYVSITNEEDDDVFNIYSNSNSLGEKTMKKLLKKIKQ